MNLNVPSGWGVTHDAGNARLPSERASSGHGRLCTRRHGPPRKNPGENPLKLPQWIVVYLPPLDEFERTKWVGSHP